MRQRLILVAAVAGLVVVLLALNTARNAAGWQPITHTPEERDTLLRPAWRLLRPPGPGPHKAAILLSGCDGVHDNMDWWAGVMLAQGRAALILDSHAPRGLTLAQSWRAVCAGQVLPGAERAGDIAAALTALRGMAGIDASDVALLGASHGSWSVMELMADLGDGAVPPGLTDWPAPPESLAAQVGPVLLLYPYCGVLSGAGRAAWPGHVQGLMILAQNDSITDPGACRKMAATLTAKGTRLQVETLAGTDHGFDQRERSALSALQFDEPARDRATDLAQDFLQGFASPRQTGL